jgi:hypothetical protein
MLKRFVIRPASLTLLTLLTGIFAGACNSRSPDEIDRAVVSVERQFSALSQVPAPRGNTPEVLLVVGEGPVGSNDLALSLRLSTLGFTVVTRSALSTVAGDALGRALVVISESVRADDLGVRLTNIPTPIVSLEPGLFDDLKMTGAGFGTNLGDVVSREIEIQAPGHPAAAGQIGRTAMSTVAQKLVWGNPGPQARRVASVVGQPNRAVVFAYEKGLTMEAGFVAPGFRAGFFAGATTPSNLNSAGWLMFDGLVRWATRAHSLLVVGAWPLSVADEQLRARLEQHGFLIDVIVGKDVQSYHAVGSGVVVISESTASVDVGSRLKNVAVPLVSLEPELWDELAMVAPGWGTNIGDSAAEDRLAIVNPTHPLAAGLSGTVRVVNSAQKFVWAKPPAGAVRIATLANAAEKAVVFGYELGAPMLGLSAPARRVGWFAGRDTAVSFRSEGWKLLDAAIVWAAQPQALLVVGRTPLSTADQTLQARLRSPLGFEVTVREASIVGPADTAGRSVVLVSESTDSTTLGSRLTGLAIPVVNLEPESWDAMGMTAGGWNVAVGDRSGQQDVVVTMPTHPLAAGLTGTVRVTQSPQKFVWGNPGAGAANVASLFGAGDLSAVFGYEASAAMVQNAAPARRVGFFAGRDTPAAFTPEGWRLFDAAIRWGSGLADLRTSGCVGAVEGASCSDANQCNGAETCHDGWCVAGIAPTCDDNQVCTTDSCNAVSGCQHVALAEGTSCADADLCDGVEACRSGVCVAGPAVVCNDKKPCTTDRCEPTTGVCTTSPSPVGTSCGDGNVCTSSGLCQASSERDSVFGNAVNPAMVRSRLVGGPSSGDPDGVESMCSSGENRIQPVFGADGNIVNVGLGGSESCPVYVCNEDEHSLGPITESLLQDVSPEDRCEAVAAPEFCAVDPTTLTTACVSDTDCAAGEVCTLICPDDRPDCPIEVQQKLCGTRYPFCGSALPAENGCRDIRQCAEPEDIGSLAETVPVNEAQLVAETPPVIPTSDPAPTQYDMGDACVLNAGSSKVVDNDLRSSKNGHSGNDKWSVDFGPGLFSKMKFDPMAFGNAELDLNTGVDWRTTVKVWGVPFTILGIDAQAKMNFCGAHTHAWAKVLDHDIVFIDEANAEGGLVNLPLNGQCTNLGNALTAKGNEMKKAMADAVKIQRSYLEEYVNDQEQRVKRWAENVSPTREFCLKTKEKFPDFSSTCEIFDPQEARNAAQRWIKHYNDEVQTFIDKQNERLQALLTYNTKGDLPFLRYDKPFTLLAVKMKYPIGPINALLEVEAGGRWAINGALAWEIKTNPPADQNTVPGASVALSGNPAASARASVVLGAEVGSSYFGANVGVVGNLHLVEFSSNISTGLALTRSKQPDGRTVYADPSFPLGARAELSADTFTWTLDPYFNVGGKVSVLKGDIDLQARVKVLWYKKTFKKKLASWPGWSQPLDWTIKGGVPLFPRVPSPFDIHAEITFPTLPDMPPIPDSFYRNWGVGDGGEIGTGQSLGFDSGCNPECSGGKVAGPNGCTCPDKTFDVNGRCMTCREQGLVFVPSIPYYVRDEDGDKCATECPKYCEKPWIPFNGECSAANAPTCGVE